MGPTFAAGRRRTVRQLVSERGKQVVRLITGIAMILVAVCGQAATAKLGHSLGRELSVEKHLQDDEEFTLTVRDLLEYGRQLFVASWTEQDGGGRPLTKGNGKA